ncbi:MAG: divalent-cation tolerance protein CutA [Spirochaetota bacterium]|nr:MAG: divalent-cation tolerance protein CutA [Spirochaetota bacterium]
MAEFVQVITTCDKADDAKKIGEELVKRRLCPCAQVSGPISSIYWWEGSIEKSEEWYCIAKAREERFKEVERVIKAIHSYEVPEIIAVPIVRGSDDYIFWMKEESYL